MNLHKSLLAAAMASAFAPAAMAQSTGDISITGMLLPNTCTITIAGGGVYDLGQINYSTLAQTGNTMMPLVSQVTNIVCSGPSLFALTVTDNRNDTLGTYADTSRMFGIGRTAGGLPIGRFELSTQGSQAEGAASPMVQSANLTTWTALSTSWPTTNGGGAMYRGYGTTGGGVINVTNAQFNLRVQAYIHGRDELQLTADASLDGSATMEIVYL